MAPAPPASSRFAYTSRAYPLSACRWEVKAETGSVRARGQASGSFPKAAGMILFDSVLYLGGCRFDFYPLHFVDR